jgi:tRNA threonylcarbamoyladenosine biosynthesis protein TsaE
LTHPGHLNELRLHLPDAAATERVGTRLGNLMQPGLKLYLSGELGSGKTCLVRAVLRGAGYTGPVRSPTYTLVEVYVVSRLHFYHFDFYRLNDKTEWRDAGFREYFNENAVCLVEWPERAGDLLPPPDLELSFEILASGRDLRIKAQSAQGENCLTALHDASL